MIASSVPTWATVAIAAISGVVGVSGTFVGDRRRRQELDQDRLLHGAEARLEALRKATATALLFREQVAEALKLVQRELVRPRSGIEPMWSWNPKRVMEYRTHEAALALLFGRNHPVTSSWRDCMWVIAESAMFAEKNQAFNEPGSVVASEVQTKATELREVTRNSVNAFLAAGTRSLEHLQPRAHRGPIRRLFGQLRHRLSTR